MTKYVEETLAIITSQFNAILDGSFKDWGTDTQGKAEHIAFYKKFVGHVYIASEQQFTKLTGMMPNSIYIVVKFSTSAIDFGQVLLPVTINAVSEQNKLDVCQKLMFDFAEAYTQTTVSDPNDFVKEVWMTPTVVSNFNDVYNGFRSLMYITGNFIIGKNSNPIEKLGVYMNGFNDPTSYIKLDPITFTSNFDIQPDTQAFYNTNGLTTSVAKIGTYSFNFTCFKVNNDFFKKCFAIQIGDMNTAPNGISTKFNFEIVYKKDTNPVQLPMLLANITMQQNKGDLPTVSLTFMR